MRSLYLLLLIGFISCRADKAFHKNYKTKYVIVIVVDGPRYSETWGDTSHEHIPFMYNVLAPQGVVHDQFYSQGETNTTSGHTALPQFTEGLNLFFHPHSVQFERTSNLSLLAIIHAKDLSSAFCFNQC